MEEKKFLYSVNPRRPIKNLNDEVPIIRTNKSLYLSKDEVRVCMKHGTVYRRFANIGKNVRVTGYDVDRLHRAEFLTEEEYKKMLREEQGQNNGTVTQVSTAADSKEAPAEEIPEEIVEPENNNESPVDEKVHSNDDSSNSAQTQEEASEILPEEEKPEEVVDTNPDMVSSQTESIPEQIAVDKTEDILNKESDENAMFAQEQEDQDADNSVSRQTIPAHIDIQGNNNYGGKKKNKHKR